MEPFGKYSKICNNSQDFGNKYINAIGLPSNVQEITDGGLLAAEFTGLLAVILPRLALCFPLRK